MTEGPLRIGLLGGVPPPLGGGGLELQIARTQSALERAGHVVVRVEGGAPDDRIDVLHALGSEPGIWHSLEHWTRNRVPLVVTSVVVVSPGRQERLMRLSTRVPGVLTSARMRREVLAQAEVVIAGTGYERDLLQSAFGVRPERIVVLGNGADPVTPAGALPEGVESGEYALLVGAVSERKRQREVVEALAGVVPVVIAGDFSGTPEERARWEGAVASTGATWLGHVPDAALVAKLMAEARAMAHLSSAEVESLAVLEALSLGSPVLLSDIPSHRELAARYPENVVIVGAPDRLGAALTSLPASGVSRVDVPTWDDVAARLTGIYADLVPRP